MATTVSMATLESDDGALNVTELLLNVTEHILQRVDDLLNEVKQESGEINLDPASLAVTVIIGFVALCFAGLAIVQGLLASGPGRLKCGKYALGSWSKLTERKRDWSEMRIRTIAYTPVISWSSMNESPYSYQAGFVDLSPSPRRKGRDEFFPATWLALLTLLEVDRPEMWKAKATGADYIPAELSSVPAYGNMQDMISLALIASGGLGRLEVDLELHLPSVHSRQSSLNFRSHPVLGLVGAFETYGVDRGLSSFDGFRPLRSRFEMARGFGRVKVAGESRRVHWLPRTKTALYHPWVARGYLDECRCQGTGRTSFETASDEYRDDGKISSFLYCGGGLINHFLLAGLERPGWAPAVFPHVAVQLSTKVLQPFLLQSNFWLQGGSYYGPIHPRGPTDELPSKESLEKRISEKTLEPPPDIYPSVFGCCLEFLAILSKQPKDAEIRSIATQIRLEKLPLIINLRVALIMQLEEIDRWVSKVAQNTWNCRAQSMAAVASMTSLAAEVYVYGITEEEVLGPWVQDGLLQAPSGCSALEFYFDHIPPNCHREEVEDSLNELDDMWKEYESSSEIGGIEAKHPLDDLLIYRMIILVILFTLAVDNSEILDNPAYDRIIPIL